VLFAGLLIGATLAASCFTPEFIGPKNGQTFVWLTPYFFRQQDRSSLALIEVLLLACAVLPWPPMTPNVAQALVRHRRGVVVAMACCVFLVALVGTDLVFAGYHLARDEALAEFDATIFRSGRAFAPIEPAWQPYGSALAPRFMLPVQRTLGFVSSYLPVNAALRAIVGLFVSPNWTSPLLAAGAVAATYGVGRRLWPDRPGPALASALLVASSSQVLVTAMTSYAMTTHLALNLLWLWLFLRADRVGHAGALLVGFLATGLHQLVFHPLFAAPFILRLLDTRRYRLAALYLAAYAGICAFWIFYWQIALGGQSAASDSTQHVGFLRFLGQVIYLMLSFDWAGAGIMLLNMLRFAAWQNPACFILLFPAWHAIRRADGIARELAAGCVFTLLAVFVVLPYQGHGWGYRYLHGVVGSLCLLSGYGWIRLKEMADAAAVRSATTMLAGLTVIALLVLLPVHADQARAFAAPYVAASTAIAQAPADVVIVDKSGLLFAEDLVRNDPFLRNSPKILDLTNLSEATLLPLCERHSVAVFDVRQAAAFGIMASDVATKGDDEVRQALRRIMAQRGCGQELVK
jgi:hypothetical protein